MKYFVMAVLGMLLGMIAGAAVLYFNPLTEAADLDSGSADRALHYALPDQVFDFTFGERAAVVDARLEKNGFWEETINGTALLGVVLADAAGHPAAVASRLIAGSADTDLLLSGVLLHDYWLLTLPNEGTVFVRAESNVWPFVKTTLVPVWFLGRPWHGPADYRTTAGPGAESSAVVLGVTGHMKGVEGSAVEQYRLTAFDRTAGSAAAVGELQLRLVPPAAVTAQQ
jgi:hypothetical protein